MTKMIKMSLIAATAVAGMSSAASAQNLEDAIKGVDVSGYVDYRLENKSVENNGAKSFNVNEYAVNVTLTSKVNDMVKATVAAGFDEVQTKNSNASGTETSSPLAQDADPSLNVSNAYFTFDLGATTVMAGKQAIPSSFVDKTDTAKSGAGVVALHKVSDALTVAGAHFMNNNIGDVYALGATAAINTRTTELLAIAKVAVVDVEAHYNTTTITGLAGGTDADHMFLKLGTDVSGVKVGFKYATASTDSTVSTVKWADASVMALSASGKAGAVSVGGTYFTADKELGTNTYSSDVALDGDNDADAHVKVWQLSTAAITTKGSGFALSASMPLADKLSGGVVYAAATNDAGKYYDVATATYKTPTVDTDYSEMLFKVDYKMSKNFLIHARYSVLNKDNGTSTDTNYSRVQVKYTF